MIDRDARFGMPAPPARDFHAQSPKSSFFFFSGSRRCGCFEPGIALRTLVKSAIAFLRRRVGGDHVFSLLTFSGALPL